ncbi:hypothetical protein L1049_025786 [Liquidambar formosana]|uniref:Chloroplast thylakoid membrane n=1 Tax=Liquidambar formosana TaxID=63359 RepID=A0AAP0R5W4_LIQFO
MTPPSLSLISSCVSSTLTALFPPESPISKQLPPKFDQQQHQQLQCSLLQIKTSRRHASLFSFLALMPSLYSPPPATAFTIGISGPKDWLREQKKKASKFLLAPIDSSRNSLHTAYLSLKGSDADYTNMDFEEVQMLLRTAARDCVPQDRNSFVTFQASTGVEVCTFRLIVKNASSLLDDKDPVKLEAEAMLNDLIRSFTSLSSLANETNVQLGSDRQKVADALMDTISSLDKFEQGVKDCLEV